jgi:hypothetical protein
MSSKKNQNRRGRTLAERENPQAVEKLILFGKNYPSGPGLVKIPIGLAPASLRVVLTYSFTTSLTSTAGSTATQLFAGNGAFDPDITGVGAQPLGYDQWSSFYLRYRVLASSIEVNLATPDITTNDQGIVRAVVTPSNTSTTFTNLSAAAAQPYAKQRLLNGVSGGVGPFAPIRSSMETDLIMGVTKQSVMSEENYGAAVSANPAELWYWHISLATADLASTSTVACFGSVHYLVDFYDRSLLSLSTETRTKLVKYKKH